MQRFAGVLSSMLGTMGQEAGHSYEADTHAAGPLTYLTRSRSAFMAGQISPSSSSQKMRSHTVLHVLACIAVQTPRVNLLHIMAELQHLSHACSPVGAPLCIPTPNGGLAQAACITFCVVCQARAASLEAAKLHVVGAQLTRLAALSLAAALFAGLQLPLQQGLLLWELILRQPFVGPVMSARKSCSESIGHTPSGKTPCKHRHCVLHVLYKIDYKMRKLKVCEQSVVRHVTRMLDKPAQYIHSTHVSAFAVTRTGRYFLCFMQTTAVLQRAVGCTQL